MEATRSRVRDVLARVLACAAPPPEEPTTTSAAVSRNVPAPGEARAAHGADHRPGRGTRPAPESRQVRSRELQGGMVVLQHASVPAVVREPAAGAVRAAVREERAATPAVEAEPAQQHCNPADARGGWGIEVGRHVPPLLAPAPLRATQQGARAEILPLQIGDGAVSLSLDGRKALFGEGHALHRAAPNAASFDSVSEKDLPFRAALRLVPPVQVVAPPPRPPMDAGRDTLSLPHPLVSPWPPTAPEDSGSPPCQ